MPITQYVVRTYNTSLYLLILYTTVITIIIIIIIIRRVLRRAIRADYRFGILAADKMSRPSIRPFVAGLIAHARFVQMET